jgi:hypothetical protein
VIEAVVVTEVGVVIEAVVVIVMDPLGADGTIFIFAGAWL